MVTFGAAQAAVEVTRWPDDVPCSAIVKNEDGSYTLTSPVTLSNGEIVPAGTTYSTDDEYHVWVTKCG